MGEKGCFSDTPLGIREGDGLFEHATPQLLSAPPEQSVTAVQPERLDGPGPVVGLQSTTPPSRSPLIHGPRGAVRGGQDEQRHPV
jgi:hypothetical protein